MATVKRAVGAYAASGPAWKHFTVQIDMTGQEALPPQSVVMGLAGQQGMSLGMEAIEAASITLAFAGAASGAMTSPTIARIESSRRRKVKSFTHSTFHIGQCKEMPWGTRSRQERVNMLPQRSCRQWLGRVAPCPNT